MAVADRPFEALGAESSPWFDARLNAFTAAHARYFNVSASVQSERGGLMGLHRGF